MLAGNPPHALGLYLMTVLLLFLHHRPDRIRDRVVPPGTLYAIEPFLSHLAGQRHDIAMTLHPLPHDRD